MYQIEMLLMFIRILREDEDVVDVHPYKDPQVVSKDIIHDALERLWRITEAKEDNSPLEGAKLRVEGGFLDILVLDLDLVEPTNKVDFRKYGGTPQCTQDGLDGWQRIPILNSSCIQRSVVDAHAPFTIRFLHQQATRCLWTRGWSDSTKSMQLVQLSSKFIWLARIHFVRVYPRCIVFRIEAYSMISTRSIRR